MRQLYHSKVSNKQGKFDWTQEENKVWGQLFLRQSENIRDKACIEFLGGGELLKYGDTLIPQHCEVSERLEQITGWKIEAVPSIIPEDIFFQMLSRKIFPCTSFIRRSEDLDYIEEPDIFHELFGHIPLLTHPGYAHFLESFAQHFLDTPIHLQKYLTRIFWYTVEFGLIKRNNSLKIYGAGVLSSYGETNRIYECRDILIKKFDIFECASTIYDYTKVQPVYFYIEDFQELFGIIEYSTLDFLEEVDAQERSIP